MVNFERKLWTESQQLARAWRMLKSVLDDGDWHPVDELVAATVMDGVPAAATRSLLADAVRHGRVQVGGDEVRGFRLHPDTLPRPRKAPDDTDDESAE